MRNYLLVIAFLFALTVPATSMAQACSSEDQDLMNTCVGDGIDTCSGTYSSCAREVDEADDVYGRFLEKCCCKNGEPRNAGQFNACKNTVKNTYKAAGAFRSILGADFKSGFYNQIKAATFAACNFGCDF